MSTLRCVVSELTVQLGCATSRSLINAFNHTLYDLFQVITEQTSRPDFRDVTKSPLAKLWAELETGSCIFRRIDPSRRGSVGYKITDPEPIVCWGT